VTDVYEPGSTFKIVGAAAALEEGVTTEDERIDCGRGSIRVADRLIRDHRTFDVLTFREVVENSSNVGMIRIGQRLGKERLSSWVRAFGFGEPTGVELPAESRGILKPSERWGPVTLASISFGQEISVTPLQMIAAVNVLANGGYLMRPRLLLGTVSPDGSVEGGAPAEPVRRVLTEATVTRLNALLEGVVERGTGRRAAIPGYTVAGKTGTAQKAVPGGYSKTDYIASFVGFAPVERPAVTALVILDSPEGDHSGSRAAGVFARIVGRSLRYLGMRPGGEPPVRVAKVWPQTPPILEPRAGLVVDPEPAPAGAPRVYGLPARDALARFVGRGLVPELVGKGVVVDQYPSPGDSLPPGERAKLSLAPPSPGATAGAGSSPPAAAGDEGAPSSEDTAGEVSE
jgi:membrane peptidoglycan carboxypeptidase